MLSDPGAHLTEFFRIEASCLHFLIYDSFRTANVRGEFALWGICPPLRHNVQVKVWNFLTARYAIVLVEKQTFRSDGSGYRPSDAPGNLEHLVHFQITQVEQGRHVPFRNDHTLAFQILTPIHSGNHQIGLLNKIRLPVRYNLAEETKILLRQREVRVHLSPFLLT